MTREIILERVWGIDFEGESRTLDMHIRTLRQKLGEAGSDDRTVRNVGYMDRMKRKIHNGTSGHGSVRNFTDTADVLIVFTGLPEQVIGDLKADALVMKICTSSTTYPICTG